MRHNADRNLLTTQIFESIPQQSIPCGVEHGSEIQLVANQHVNECRFAYCVLSHTPSRWPLY